MIVLLDVLLSIVHVLVAPAKRAEAHDERIHGRPRPIRVFSKRSIFKVNGSSLNHYRGISSSHLNVHAHSKGNTGRLAENMRGDLVR